MNVFTPVSLLVSPSSRFDVTLASIVRVLEQLGIDQLPESLPISVSADVFDTKKTNKISTLIFVSVYNLYLILS